MIRTVDIIVYEPTPVPLGYGPRMSSRSRLLRHGHPTSVLCTSIRSALHQQLHHPTVAAQASIVQRSLPQQLGTLRVDIRSVLQQ